MRLTLLAICLIVSGCASIERLAIPSSELRDSSLNQAGTLSQIDHSTWDGFLQRYTIKDNAGVVRVRYSEVTLQDHNALSNYINALSRMDARQFTRDAQLAYWSNLYNAKTVDVILDHYPVASIRHIKDGFFDLGPWEDKRLNVNGVALSLHDIEHGIVRPLWSDEPRVHYLLNCAAAGCPNLGQRAYTAENVHDAMQKAAIEFVNNARGAERTSNGRLILSKIYSWYRGDFGGSDDSLVEHLNEYATHKTRVNVIGDSPNINAYRYDWSLNDAKTVAQ